MAPENEGKPAANMSGKTVEVPFDELVEIENYLAKMQVQMEDICSSDVMFNLSFEGDNNPEPQDSLVPVNQLNRSEAVRVLATKQDNVRIHNELVLLKLRNIIPRHKGSGEDVSSNLNLKRSRPLSPLHVPRVPSITCPVDSKVEILPLADGGDSPHGTNGPTFDIASPSAVEMLPLKFIRTGDNTKAPFQKPSTIFMPTAKLGVPNFDTPNVPSSGDTVSVAPGMISKPCSSPKKRPSRSRRDRNRTRNKVAVLPEPVMQRLMPGDTNKIPEDGFLWRKYGNKPIKTASYKRGYYKCRHFKEVKCNATKIVQQTNNDPSTFSVCYKGEHTCKQQGNLVGAASGRPPLVGQDSISLADQVNENRNKSDPKSPEEADKDDLLDGMDDSSDSASDDLFAPWDNGEEAVESAISPVEHAQPTPPLIDFEMPAIVSMTVDTMPTEISVQPASPWTTAGDFKVKYHQPIETCPPEGQDMDQAGLLQLEDDNDQLLKMINGGLWDHPSYINYWCQDMDSLSNSHSDTLQF